MHAVWKRNLFIRGCQERPNTRAWAPAQGARVCVSIFRAVFKLHYHDQQFAALDALFLVASAITMAEIILF
jgi:hypothetical protein